MHETMRQPPRGDDEIGQAVGEFGRLFVWPPGGARHAQRTYLATSRATTAETVSPSARAA